MGNPVLKAALPTLSYCLCSMVMIYTNKYVVSKGQLDFHYATILLMCQAAIAVLSLKILQALKVIKLEAFNWQLAFKWMPVTIGFGLMLFTGSKTLIYLTVPIITVFKNLTNLLIAYGDWHFFGQKVPCGVAVSFGLMLVGSVMSGFTDLAFDFWGYMWMAGNCCAQATYVLYMRQAKKTTQLTEWGMSYYNNILSIPLLGLGALLSGEFWDCLYYPRLQDPIFLAAVILSGLVGTALSLSVFWVVSVTSPTTYSMIGSMNKIPITLLSFVFFNIPWNVKSLMSICVGLASGIIYTFAKLYESAKGESKPQSTPLREVKTGATK